jgi:hypothetical protein
MSDRPTPETDAEFPKLYDSQTEWVHAAFARRLERERDAAKAQLRKEWQLHVQTLDDCDEAREQRDMLASTLETIRFNAVDDDIRLLSDQALAAVKGEPS